MYDIETLEEFLKFWINHGWIPSIKQDRVKQYLKQLENLIQENKELKEYKKIAELTKVSCCTAQNCEALNNAIRERIIINKAIDYIGIDKELEECCEMIDVNGIELLKILRGEK